MMKFFMIEWWNEVQGKYCQEYYVSMEKASARFIMLRDHIADSNPEISTHVMGD